MTLEEVFNQWGCIIYVRNGRLVTSKDKIYGLFQWLNGHYWIVDSGVMSGDPEMCAKALWYRNEV